MTEGLNYEMVTWNDSRVHVLEVDLSVRRIGSVPAAPYFPMLGPKPPELAKGAGALASVGGGFPITSQHHLGVDRQPLGVYVRDDELWTTGLGRGGQVFLAGPGGRAWIQPNTSTVRFWRKGEALRIDHVNRGNEDTVLFTFRGGTNELPSPKREHTILGNPSAPVLEEGVVQYWDVMNPATVFREAGRLKRRFAVIETDEALGWSTGETVRYHYDLGHPTTGALSGMTLMVAEGKNVVSDIFGGASGGPDAWYIRKNPRTALAVAEDRRNALVVAVEGRVPGSKGLRLKEFARFLIELGAWEAVNFDGGGSTHMWVRGEPNRGLVADSCYGDGTVSGLRPNIYATAVF